MGKNTTATTDATTTDTESGEHGAAVGLLEGKGHWKGKRLQLTDADTVERLRRPYLWPSTSTIFAKDCPTRWAVEKLVGEGEENPFAATFTGTCVHAVLEAITVAPAAKRTPAFFDRLVLEVSDVNFPLQDDATDDEVASAADDEVALGRQGRPRLLPDGGRHRDRHRRPGHAGAARFQVHRPLHTATASSPPPASRTSPASS